MDQEVTTFQFGPFSERFEKIQTLYFDPGFSHLLARDLKSENEVRLQLLHLPSLEGKASLEDQWEAIRSCESLWFRPQEWLTKNHYGILLSWVPPGRYFNEIQGTLRDEFYLQWMKEALRDLLILHQKGILHLAQNERSWILFKADEEQGTESFGLSDLGLLTEVPLGQRVTRSAMVAVAPEILRCQEVDGRADLYSLACLLLRQRMARQFQQFKTIKSNFELHWEGRMVEMVPESETPLNNILRKMLQPNPEDRPASALELLREIDHQTEISEGPLQSFPEWALARIQGRQMTLLLNTLLTLVDYEETETAAGILKEVSDHLEKDHKVYLWYLQARLTRLRGDQPAAEEWRKKATEKCHSQPDPKLKTLLFLEDSRVCRESGEMSEALSFLDQAWETIQDYPDLNLQIRVLYERSRTRKMLGEDEKALEELQKAYDRIPETEEHPWKANVYGDLAELLASYGMPRQSGTLMEQVLAQPEDDPRSKAYENLQAALVFVSLLDWERAEKHFSEAKSIYSSLRDLKSLIWAGAHAVRMHFAKGDFVQARRELKALKSRNRGRGFHTELLDLLELRLWLETGESLSSSSEKLLEKIQERAKKELEERFFRDLGWPIVDTCSLYERCFQKIGRYSQITIYAKTSNELRKSMLSKLKEFNYEEEGPAEPFPILSVYSPVEIESLLDKEKCESQEIAEEGNGEEHPEVAPLKERIRRLEAQLLETTEWKRQLIQDNERHIQEIRKLKEQLEEKRKKEKRVSVPKVRGKPKFVGAEGIVAPVISEIKEEVDPSEEKKKIEEVLRKYQGNKSKAAKELKIHRRTLFEKIKKYGLHDLEFLPNRDEIIAVLESCEKNKSIAAKKLGMSRSSFYRRMQELGIS